MATQAQVTAHAQAWIDVANKIKQAFELTRELSLYNGVNDPNWSDLANQVPEAVDAAGLVVGTEVTPADIANAIGSANNLMVMLDGTGQPAQSAWINNIQKIAKPLV